MDKSKYFAAAEKAAQKGQIDKALEAYEYILRADPNDLKALTRLADLQLKEQHFEKAIESFSRIGELYSRDGFYSKAVAIYKRILKIDRLPSRSLLITAHEKLAALYGQLGLISDAMNHFAIVVDFYDQVGEKEQLLSTLKKVSDLDPQNIENQLKLLDLMMAQNQMQAVLERLGELESQAQERSSTVDLVRIYEKFVEYFPKDSEKMKELIRLLLQVGEPKKALAKLQLSFKSDPRNPEVMSLLVETFSSLKQPEKVRAVESELLKLYRELGRQDDAAALEAQMKSQQAKPEESLGVYRSDATKKVVSTSGDATLDPVESLVKAMPLSPEEKKVLTECSVYLKYGLSEKVYEVLRSRVSEFPKSLVLRWKLKVSTQDLKKDEETKHLLSEIILLARDQKLELWKSIAMAELKALDPRHPALDESKSESLPAGMKMPTVEPEDLKTADFDLEEGSSDVSIVVEDDFIIEPSAVSEVSFQEFDEQSKVESSETLVLESASDSLGHHDVEEPTESEVDVFLSESDFSDDELKALDMNLEPKSTVSGQMKPTLDESQNSTMDSPIDLGFSESIEIRAENTEDETGTEAEAGQDAAGSASERLMTPLEEADFYESQGLIDEAVQALVQAQKAHPDDKAVATKLSALQKNSASKPSDLKQQTHELEALGRKIKMNVQTDERTDDADFFDLAGEIHNELENDSLEKTPEVKDVFEAFKSGVAATIDKSDWQTHLDLGIAYREMHLLDDALEEFKLVANVPEQRVTALYQMGLTHMAKEDWFSAEQTFMEALRVKGLTLDQKKSLQYELAEALTQLQQTEKAQKLFAEILKNDPDYREVSQRVSTKAS